MTHGSFITDEMRAQIGIEVEPQILEIEKEPIRRWAAAIGDKNPLYYDEEYAKKHGYKNLVTPPGFLVYYDYPLKPPQSDTYRYSLGLRVPLERTLNGGNEFEFYKPVCAGETVKMVAKIFDLFERDGRLGKMLFVVTQFEYIDIKGETLEIGRHFGIWY